MNQQVNALDILARAKTLVLSRPQDFTQAGRDLDSDFSAESICAERRRVLSGFPLDLKRDFGVPRRDTAKLGLEHDLARQSTPWSRFGVALRDTAKLSPLGLDAAEARRVLVLAWLAFDSEADTREPKLAEFQRLPWRGANDRFWQGREIPAENWVQNEGFLRLAEAAFEKVSDGAPSNEVAEFPKLSDRAVQVLDILLRSPTLEFIFSEDIVNRLRREGVEADPGNLRRRELANLKSKGLVESGPGGRGWRIVPSRRDLIERELKR
jgi:hypothetical protein